MCKVVFSVFVLTGSMFEMATVASSGIRHYMPILGPTTPPFSRWPWNPHPVRQSKLDNLFTYLPSCMGEPFVRIVDVHIVVGWGRTACARHRFWAHVSVHAWSWRFAVGKSWAKHVMESKYTSEHGQGSNGRIYMHHTRNNICIHADHFREYQS